MSFVKACWSKCTKNVSSYSRRNLLICVVTGIQKLEVPMLFSPCIQRRFGFLNNNTRSPSMFPKPFSHIHLIWNVDVSFIKVKYISRINLKFLYAEWTSISSDTSYIREIKSTERKMVLWNLQYSTCPIIIMSTCWILHVLPKIPN